MILRLKPGKYTFHILVKLYSDIVIGICKLLPVIYHHSLRCSARSWLLHPTVVPSTYTYTEAMMVSILGQLRPTTSTYFLCHLLHGSRHILVSPLMAVVAINASRFIQIRCLSWVVYTKMTLQSVLKEGFFKSSISISFSSKLLTTLMTGVITQYRRSLQIKLAESELSVVIWFTFANKPSV